MKHLYLSKAFTRQARRSGLADESMIEAVDRAEEGKSMPMWAAALSSSGSRDRTRGDRAASGR
jgi:hypothetical protein